jgi:hypothetical protein
MPLLQRGSSVSAAAFEPRGVDVNGHRPALGPAVILFILSSGRGDELPSVLVPGERRTGSLLLSPFLREMLLERLEPGTRDIWTFKLEFSYS